MAFLARLGVGRRSRDGGVVGASASALHARRHQLARHHREARADGDDSVQAGRPGGNDTATNEDVLGKD